MSSNCYLLVDEFSKHCICIDPASEKSILEIKYIEENGLSLDYIILTHEHTDHTWGCNSLIDEFHPGVICSEVCKQNLSKEIQAYFRFYFDDVKYLYRVCQIDFTTEKLENELAWCEYNITFIPTPGHSMGSICCQIGDNLFSGDTILQSKPYINKRNGSKELFLESIRQILEKVDERIMIYPGHGNEFQLKDYCVPDGIYNKKNQ